MQTERRVAANPQTKPTDLGCESAERLAATIRRHHRHLLLFHDLLSAPMFHHSVWSAITAHKLTPAKRDVNTVVSDQRLRFTAPSIGDYNTSVTGQTRGQRNSPVTEYTHKNK